MEDSRLLLRYQLSGSSPSPVANQSTRSTALSGVFTSPFERKETLSRAEGQPLPSTAELLQVESAEDLASD